MASAEHVCRTTKNYEEEIMGRRKGVYRSFLCPKCLEEVRNKTTFYKKNFWHVFQTKKGFVFVCARCGYRTTLFIKDSE